MSTGSLGSSDSVDLLGSSGSVDSPLLPVIAASSENGRIQAIDGEIDEMLSQPGESTPLTSERVSKLPGMDKKVAIALGNVVLVAGGVASVGLGILLGATLITVGSALVLTNLAIVASFMLAMLAVAAVTTGALVLLGKASQ